MASLLNPLRQKGSVGIKWFLHHHRRDLSTSNFPAELFVHGGRVYNEETFCTIDVRWGDQDAMNHVNNATYFTYFEQVRCLWWEKSKIIPGLSASTVIEIAPILSSTQCKFRRPVEFPDSLLVGLSCELVNRDRGHLRHHYVVYSENQAAIVAEGTADIVAYNYHAKSRAPVPEEWV